MKVKLLVLVTIIISGCASQVVSLGENQYRITMLPSDEYKNTISLKTKLEIEAKDFCDSIGLPEVKTIELNNKFVKSLKTDAKQELVRTELEFACSK